ncbi:manganese ABC transporter substrate-binding protein/adhesin MntA [soil metagenome]
MKLLISLLSAGVMLFVMGCSSDSETQPTDNKIYIVTTTGMIADAVEHVAGEYATVEALMAPGVDPHLYKATGSDLEKLNKADLVFYNGLHLEGKMTDVLAKLGKKKTVVGLGDNLPHESLINYGTVHDPHIWFDVKLWSGTLPLIADALKAFDAPHADTYTANAAAYQKELLELHAWVQEQLNKLPANQRILVTAHDAFEYFGKAYGMEVKGLQGISTVSEYGLKDVTNVVDMLVNRKIKAVFVESSVSDKALKAVVEGAADKGHTVAIGGTLFSDAMGAADKPEGKYVGMVKYNVKTIVEALR